MSALLDEMESIKGPIQVFPFLLLAEQMSSPLFQLAELNIPLIERTGENT